MRTSRPWDPGGATPEAWTRATFGDVPDLVEWFIWRGLLGFRLASGPSPQTVAGWRIGAEGDDWVRLEATSPLLEGNLVVESSAGRVALGTLLRGERRRGALTWRLLGAVHRRLVPRLLGAAARRVAP